MRYSWKYSDSRFFATELLKLLSFWMDSILSFLTESPLQLQILILNAKKRTNILKLTTSHAMKLVQEIAWFVVIFGINTTSDISKLLYIISRAVGRVKFETILKYHEWYLCQISRANRAIIWLYYYPHKVCNFHMKIFQIKPKYHCSKPIKLQKFLMW